MKISVNERNLIMRFLVIAKRKDGVLEGATPEQVADLFTKIQEYYGGLREHGVLADAGRLVGEHAQFQIYEVANREALDPLLKAAPNTEFVNREIYEIGPLKETVDRLRARVS